VLTDPSEKLDAIGVVPALPDNSADKPQAEGALP
jgi:hypothetical protein